MIQVKPGRFIPIYIALESRAIDKYIRVEIINPITGELLATVLPEPVVGRAGHYADHSYMMPELSNLVAIVSVFEADEETQLSEDLVPITALESVVASGGQQNYADLVAIIDDDSDIDAEIDSSSDLVATLEEV